MIRSCILLLLVIVLVGCQEERPWYCIKLSNNDFPAKIKSEDIDGQLVHFEELSFRIPKELTLSPNTVEKKNLTYANDSAIVIISTEENVFDEVKREKFSSKTDRDFYQHLYEDSNGKLCEIKSLITPAVGENFMTKYISEDLDFYQYGNAANKGLVVFNGFSDRLNYLIVFKGVQEKDIHLFLSSINFSKYNSIKN